MSKLTQIEINPKYETHPHSALTEQLVKHNEWLVVLSLLITLGIWSAVVDWGNLPAFVLPSPSAVWQKLLQTLVKWHFAIEYLGHSQ